MWVPGGGAGYLYEVGVCPRDGGVPGLGQDVLVILGVDKHAEAQVLLDLPVREVLLGAGLVLFHPQNCLKVDPSDL